MSGRRGRLAFKRPPLYSSEDSTVARMIHTGSDWLFAWMFQQAVGYDRLAKLSGVLITRITELAHGAEPTEAEAEAMAPHLRTDAASLRASVAFGRLVRIPPRP